MGRCKLASAVCSHCGAQFMRDWHDLKKAKRVRYCSRACWRAAVLTGGRPTMTVVCDGCGVSFEKMGMYVRRQQRLSERTGRPPRHYCTPACYQIGRAHV